ncbi:MAG: sulfurtransferase TusA family protein [Acidimicrobiia bacterium]|nr:sulfurtransferase TusA family protein [Acidimicrobiia bacterium]
MTIDNQPIAATDTLDCSGLLCPLPVYKAALALGKLEAGDILELITTDPGALEDIPAMARQRGDTLLSTDDNGTTQVFYLEKGAA